MPVLLRKMGWVAVSIFVLEALFVTVGPNVSVTIKQEVEETGQKTVLVSQGAALLVIAAGVFLARTVFAVPDPPPMQSRDPGAADSPTSSGSATSESARLLAVSSAGQETRLVVESVSGEQLRLLVVTENPISSVAHGDADEQEQGDWGRQRLAEVSRWLVASIGFVGALFVLVDENPVLAILILGPQIYGLTIAYVLVGVWTLWRSLAFLLGSGSTA